MALPEQHSEQDFSKVKGTAHTRDTYKSGMWPNHPTLKPKQNFKKRDGAGSGNHGDGPKL
jgi:hypothetical protein